MADEQKIIFTKETKAFCGTCWDLLFVFSRDIIGGEMSSTDQIYPNQGQPWKPKEPLVCKKCGEPQHFFSIIFSPRAYSFYEKVRNET